MQEDREWQNSSHITGRRPNVRGLPVDAEIDQEIEAHLDMLVDDLVAEGWDPEAARQEAMRQFGSMKETRARCEATTRSQDRKYRIVNFLDGCRHDLRYALRLLKQAPMFTFVVIVSLAFGIGANTAIFSIFNSFFLRSLPVDSPGELVEIYWSEEEMTYGPFSYPYYLDLKEQTADVFTDLITYDISIGILEHESGSEYIFGEAVSGNYFKMLGIVPVLGRFFIPDVDDLPGSAPTAVLSYNSWQNRFGADQDVLGRTMRVTGVDYMIVGVAPEEFDGMMPFSGELWVPLVHDPMIGGGLADLNNRQTHFLFSVKGRLKPNASFKEARASVETACGYLQELYPGEYYFTVLPAESISIHAMFDTPIRMFTLFLMIMVGLALLIACTNLASMLLARATARRKEIAVRLAIGSGRWRLIRQMVTESVLLAMLGGALGLLVAWWLIQALISLQPPFPIPLNLQIEIDGGVLIFTALLSLTTGIVFGLLPALHSSRTQPISAIKGEVSGAGLRLKRFRLRNTLVIIQVTVSALLLVCTGLFLRSMSNAGNIDPGFDLRQGLFAILDTSVRKYSPEETRTFFRELQQRVQAQPGVESTALACHLPMGPGILTSVVHSEEGVGESLDSGVQVDYARIGPGYFATMGIALLNGRPFDSSDIEGSGLVAVINQSLAERLWPEENAIGKRLQVESLGEQTWEIIGITRNGKYRTLGEPPRSFIYLPFSQSYTSRMGLVVRTAGDPAALMPVVREDANFLDPDMPIFELKTIAGHMEIMLFIPKLIAVLLGGLGMLALGLGIIGLYGVISYDVARRTQEVGIRMALGARRSEIIRQVVGEGFRLVGIGAVLGLGAAILLTRLLAAMLLGISPTDPVTFLTVVMILAVITLAASWVPARRAATLDPMAALRYE